MADPTHKYKVVKLMIEMQQIIIFSQIIDYVPKSVIAAELKTNTTRLTRLLADPLRFNLYELKALAKRIEIPVEKLIELAFLQDTNKQSSTITNKKSRKKK
jgi:hypothetical protein